MISHSIKVWERVVEARLKREVVFSDQQYGFLPWKSTTDADTVCSEGVDGKV